MIPIPTLEESKRVCLDSLQHMRQDHVRSMNATPYKVSVSVSLFDFMHKLWLEEAPIADLN